MFNVACKLCIHNIQTIRLDMSYSKIKYKYLRICIGWISFFHNPRNRFQWISMMLKLGSPTSMHRGETVFFFFFRMLFPADLMLVLMFATLRVFSFSLFPIFPFFFLMAVRKLDRARTTFPELSDVCRWVMWMRSWVRLPYPFSIRWRQVFSLPAFSAYSKILWPEKSFW